MSMFEKKKFISIQETGSEETGNWLNRKYYFCHFLKLYDQWTQFMKKSLMGNFCPILIRVKPGCEWVEITKTKACAVITNIIYSLTRNERDSWQADQLHDIFL